MQTYVNGHADIQAGRQIDGHNRQPGKHHGQTHIIDTQTYMYTERKASRHRHL